jgi:hypothetical protein
MNKAAIQPGIESPRPIPFCFLLCIFSFLSLILAFTLFMSFMIFMVNPPCQSMAEYMAKFVAENGNFLANCGNFPANSGNFLARFGKVWLGVFPDEILNNPHFCPKKARSPKSNTPSPLPSMANGKLKMKNPQSSIVNHPSKMEIPSAFSRRVKTCIFKGRGYNTPFVSGNIKSDNIGFTHGETG